ncbi:MAG: ChaN family lipoprotein [Leptospiraceae bacterium]|nr:ChaN family lipoprotein [Leptospiraceae bacterium]
MEKTVDRGFHSRFLLLMEYSSLTVLKRVPVPGRRSRLSRGHILWFQAKLFKHTLVLTLFIGMSFFANNRDLYATDPQSWSLFASRGNRIDWSALTQQAASAEVVLFGELHNNPVAHWLQLQLMQSLVLSGKTQTTVRQNQWCLGLEMFSTDQNAVLAEWSKNLINDNSLENDIRLWPNYKTDYQPLLHFARSRNFCIFGSNAPRRYANLVARKGFDALADLPREALPWLPRLPIDFDPEIPSYKRMQQMKSAAHGSHGLPWLAQAQALKDATMAWQIRRRIIANQRVLHINGRYHSDNQEGIVWYLKRMRPDTQMITISTATQSDVSTLQPTNYDLADYIIIVDESFPGSY